MPRRSGTLRLIAGTKACLGGLGLALSVSVWTDGEEPCFFLQDVCVGSVACPWRVAWWRRGAKYSAVQFQYVCTGCECVRVVRPSCLVWGKDERTLHYLPETNVWQNDNRTLHYPDLKVVGQEGHRRNSEKRQHENIVPSLEVCTKLRVQPPVAAEAVVSR